MSTKKGKAKPMSEFDEACEISDWLDEGREWLEALPQDAEVDVSFLMIQFGIEDGLAENLLDLWSDMLEPMEEADRDE